MNDATSTSSVLSDELLRGCAGRVAAYDRDNRFYLDWDPITRDEDAIQAWLEEWVYGVADRAEYMAKLGAERMASLRPSAAAPSGSVDYGAYR